MSYFNYPRIHFSGRFEASPSTINNTPNNYDPSIYPSPNELAKVELYWHPLGNGGFAFADCVVKQVDYEDGTSATTAEADPIIGQPVISTRNPAFPLAAALVDLDPMQQNVTEIWALSLQIGSSSASLVGDFIPVSFSAIWGQAQGPGAPRSSASGSGIYQSTLTNLKVQGGAGGSKFLQHFVDQPDARASMNFNLNTHNNGPPNYRFDEATFQAMAEASQPVPQDVLTKILPMQKLIQMTGDTPGDVPTKSFVRYMLQQYLTVEEFNDNIDTILKTTALPYAPSTSQDFLFGLTTGTIAPSSTGEPEYFVANRMMNPATKGPVVYFAPFVVSADGHTIQLNLGNSYPTELPGTTPWAEKLGRLFLVAFTDGIDASTATRIAEIDYAAAGFITDGAGFFTATADIDCSQTPLGLVSEPSDGPAAVLLAEDKEGYYLRANQFVFRMNPGLDTTPAFPRGETATAEIHALQFGQPVPDGTPITMTMMGEKEAESYTAGTLGTSGTAGIENLSIPQDALTINNELKTSTAATQNGVARFDLACTPPGNPRLYVDGQIYFLNYNFADVRMEQDPNDIVSVQVYDEQVALPAPDLLAKWGRIYNIMSFLTDEAKVRQIDRRNMIKLLIEKPFDEVVHMPVTRDLGEAARKKIVDWIDTLNAS